MIGLEISCRRFYTGDAIRIKAKLETEQHTIDGDAAIEQPSPSSGRANQPPSRSAGTGDRQKCAVAKQPQSRWHFVDDLHFAHNRTGFALRPGFNDGSCTQTTQMKGGSSLCPEYGPSMFSMPVG